MPAREIKTLPKKKRIRHILKRLVSAHDSPRRLSVAIGVGVFIGTLPFFGFHMWIGLLVALIARLNKLAVLLGTQVSLPWIAPFLIVGSIEIGEWVLYGQFLKISIPTLQLKTLIAFLYPLFCSWIIGSLILGTILGLIFYGLSFYIVTAWNRRRVRETVQPQIDSKDVVTK
jgi:uncharacterized protein (TIGR03546 family)